MDTQIERARSEDIHDVLDLLTANHLPLDGLREHLDTLLVARHDGRVVGSAALEMYPDGALLRSVAITPALQRRRLGRDLTEAALHLARERQVAAVFLLTTTAERYFRKFGFERITRDEVPSSVQASIEFTSACPSSASVMRKRL
jgi:amino-acid N-acetyltransferase